MIRKDIERIVNRLAMHSHSLDFDVIAAYDLIFNYCKEHKTVPSNNSYALDNGVLVINGKHIDRVQPLIKPFDTFDERSYYYEGLCIKDYD